MEFQDAYEVIGDIRGPGLFIGVEFVKDKVAPYKRIRQVELREELPMTLVGKVLKKDLREEAR